MPLHDDHYWEIALATGASTGVVEQVLAAALTRGMIATVEDLFPAETGRPEAWEPLRKLLAHRPGWRCVVRDHDGVTVSWVPPGVPVGEEFSDDSAHVFLDRDLAGGYQVARWWAQEGCLEVGSIEELETLLPEIEAEPLAPSQTDL